MSVNLFLLQNQTTNGTGTPVIFEGFTEGADVLISGAFGGGSVQLEINVAASISNNSDALANWIPLGNTITSASSQRIEMSRLTKLRASLVGSTGANITAILHYQ